MSTLFGTAAAFRPGPPAALHQSNSWRALIGTLAPWRPVALWSARRRQRLALSELTAQQLDDIGVTRAQALREAGKPFWKP